MITAPAAILIFVFGFGWNNTLQQSKMLRT